MASGNAANLPSDEELATHLVNPAPASTTQLAPGAKYFAQGAWSASPRLRPASVLAVEVAIAGLHVTVVSYYAPPGVNWGRVKVDQALAVAKWLCDRKGPIIIGADANTPKLDPVDGVAVRTHWHTGCGRLNGGPGDDELWGPSPRHPLRDCLRTWLAADPARATHLHPDGPLAVSHYTGKRKTHVGTPRRFDSIWVTPDFTVRDVQYLSHEIGRLSDHAPVVADLEVRRTRF